MCHHVLSRTLTVHGAIYTFPNRPQARVWAIWTRNIYGQKREHNITRVIRLGIDDESLCEGILKIGITAIWRMVQKEANEWNCGTVEIWNPEDRIRQATEGIEGLGVKFVTRESHHLSSMQWLREGCIDEVDWICNEGLPGAKVLGV